jgi:hypothetical protein
MQHREASSNLLLTVNLRPLTIISEANMAGKGRPKLGKAAKDAQVMVRMTEQTHAALKRIAVELDRSVSWLLNDIATKFIASHKSGKH